jgi:UDP-N-acetylglucosamine--N-acetylmuramyl-(pentapeptide) pyrophosphoryl-undecaprenol N-acetylglucosamine transferase
MKSRTIVFAGGGTAGHVQPALAVARTWKIENPNDRIIFLGTSSGLETSLVPQSGFELELITRVRVPRKVSPSVLSVPFQLWRAVSESRRILKNADLLIGFGGYVCAPAYIAAAIKKIPIVIHEANAKPGWANRLGAFFTESLAVGTPVVDGKFATALITGIPLRADIAELLSENRNANEQTWVDRKSSEKTHFGFQPHNPLVLIIGGSQGSQAINAVVAVTKDEINQKSVAILHAVGGTNALAPSTEMYKAVSYIDEMARAYVAADLVIARSGAITCSEVRALGRFTIFVPLAIGNGEQMVNAQDLVERGIATVVSQESFTPRWLIDNISTMIKQSSTKVADVDYSDLDAAKKISALMVHAIENSKG